MRACFYLSGGISSVGLRPWTVYGVGRDRELTAGPTLAIRAVALWQPFRIRLTGHMDLQYVADVAESFVRYALASLERLRPGASRIIAAEGPRVPVAYPMDGTQLRAHVPGITQTPLED